MAATISKGKNDDCLRFQVKPRLLTLLGDQLIRDANLAVFELVKNAYDANATKCSVILENPDDSSRAHIIIQDDGTGMDEHILRDVWMMIATDHKALQRAHNSRTAPPFNRFPLGEKGLGRLSIHKLVISFRWSPEQKAAMNWSWSSIGTSLKARRV